MHRSINRGLSSPIALLAIATLALAACDRGAVEPHLSDAPRPSLLPLATTPVPPMISAAWWHTCALRADRTLVCWGRVPYGAQTPPLDGLTGVIQVDAAVHGTCALKADSTVVCAGTHAVPAGLTDVVQVGAGYLQSCALKADGTVTCWGSPAAGPPPAGLSGVTQLSVGDRGTCALKSDGTVACWPYDASVATPPAGLAGVTQVSVGDMHACALKADGTVVCWGWNSYDQAAPPAGLASVAQVSAANHHTCAVKMDGTVVCWGDNSTGQATPPAGLSGVTQVAAGSRHSCALKTDGTVVCWGDNGYGQLNVPAGLDLDKLSQTITFTSVPPRLAYVGGSYTVSAVGGGSGNPVTFFSYTPGVCTITASTAKFVGIGTCTIVATQAGNASYYDARPVSQSFSVSWRFLF